MKKIIVILLLIVLVIIGIFLVPKEKIEDKVIFKEMEVIEYGSEVKSESYILEGKEYIKQYPNIDTMKVGKYSIVYTLTNDQELTYEIEIVDNNSPVIEFNEGEITIRAGEEFDYATNIKRIYDVVDQDLTVSEEKQNGSYTVEYKEYENENYFDVIIMAYDVNGNESSGSFRVNVEKEEIEEAPQENTQEENTQEEVIVENNQEQNNENNEQTIQQEEENEVEQVQPYYVNGILLVNKKHAIPRDFGGYNDEAYQALVRLQNDAYALGYDMSLLSGYRSYDYQKQLYESYVARDGQAAADRYSARPGTSEHQTGLAFDVASLEQSFGQSEAGIWLANHAHEYGFIIRYPQGKEHITGYMYEPWHIRYLGYDVANDVYASGLTLEEYLGDY